MEKTKLTVYRPHNHTELGHIPMGGLVELSPFGLAAYLDNDKVVKYLQRNNRDISVLLSPKQEFSPEGRIVIRGASSLIILDPHDKQFTLYDEILRRNCM